MTELNQQKCIPCRKGDPSISEDQLAEWLPQIPDWRVEYQGDVPQLERAFTFKDFTQALAFTNEVGALAEEQDHHPALLTEWGRVTVRWWTHAIHGLHINDLISAAKTDKLYEETFSDQSGI